MPASHVDHAVLAAHAKDKVNISSEDAAKRRAQVNDLRTRLETYIAAHPDYDLVKLRASGSTAKHTAIRRRRGEGSDLSTPSLDDAATNRPISAIVNPASRAQATNASRSRSSGV